MTRSLVQEIAPIRVNSISPRIIKTEITDNYRPLFENTLDRVLLGCIGLPQDVAKIVRREDLKMWNWDDIPAKSSRRDKKQHKKKHGMRIDGQSVRLIDRIIGRKGKAK